MKKFYSFLALLTLCAMGTTFTSDTTHSLEWWQVPNPTVIFENGSQFPVRVFVDNLTVLDAQGTSHKIAVGIVDFKDHSVWAVFTKNGPLRYNPGTNTFGQNDTAYNFVSINELTPELQALVVPSFKPAVLPQQPVVENNAPINDTDAKNPTETEQPNTQIDAPAVDTDEEVDDQKDPQHDDQSNKSNPDDTPKSRSLIGSTIDFLTGKPFLVTVSASTCAAVATFYAADWYNTAIVKERTEKKVDRRYAAAVAGISTAVIFGGYFYYAAGSTLEA